MVQVHVPRGVGVRVPPWAPNPEKGVRENELPFLFRGSYFRIRPASTTCPNIDLPSHLESMLSAIDRTIFCEAKMASSDDQQALNAFADPRLEKLFGFANLTLAKHKSLA